MFVVIPFCHKDEWLCVKQLEWAAKLGGCDGYDAIVVHDDVVTGDNVIQAAKRVFSNVSEVSYPRWTGKNTHWPVPQNHQFQNLVTHVYHHGPKDSYFWWEPDCTPLKRGWLEEIEAEYAKGGKPFMGHIVTGDPFRNGQTIHWMTGCGVYPHNVPELSGQIMMCMNIPWDVASGNEILKHTHRANHLIQHIWERNGQPFHFEDRKDTDSVLSKTAVVFHRCKDGSLIDALNGEPLSQTIARSIKDKVNALSRAARRVFATGGRPAIVQLGRNGDIVNALPAIRMIGERSGARPVVVASSEFAPLLDGVSFADCEPYGGHFGDLRGGTEFAETKFKNVIVGQVWGANIDVQQKCSSYNMDNWERLGCLERWNEPQKPLFDKRDRVRERSLIKASVAVGKEPVLAISLSGGMTSRLDRGEEIKEKIIGAFSDRMRIVDLDQIVAERIYDVLGILEIADAIITSDTVWLHLAQDVQTPVAAFLSSKGDWMQTIPRCNCTLRMTQTDDHSLNKLFTWLDARVDACSRRRVIHCCEEHFPIPRRVKRAQSTWRSLEENGNWKVVMFNDYRRDARSLGEKRALPFLKDVLQAGLNRCGADDIVLMSNDDTILSSNAFGSISEVLSRSVAVSSNRVDLESFSGSLPENPDTKHIGRDIIAFKASWLRRHMDDIPDYILGVCDWDIGLAAQIRHLAGVEWSIATSAVAYPDCELKPGTVFHERHDPTWVDDRAKPMTGGLIHNRKLVKEWATNNMPSMEKDLVWWNKI